MSKCFQDACVDFPSPEHPFVTQFKIYRNPATVPRGYC
jgi:hypothetical protein